MEKRSLRNQEPTILIWAIVGVFATLAVIRLTVLTVPFFDEVHYLPAAKAMLEGGAYLNQEHPLLGKELIAIGIAIFGDNPWGWRIASLLAGVLALYASMGAMWLATQSRFATIAFGILLATGFILLVHARLAMLDIFMVAALCVAAWQFAGALREPELARKRLAITGIALGAAMAAKWNAVPLAMLPGLAFLVARVAAGRKRLLTSTRGVPIPGISLLEAALWLGLVPLLTYAATFIPALFLEDSPLSRLGLIGLHRDILDLQTQVLAPHNYESVWSDWVLNLRAIWYYYEEFDGVQRGVLLIGNPVTMLLGLPALLWCLWRGIAKGDWARLSVVIGYAVSLGLWLVADKSVQFYYHYFVPSMFLLAALAMMLDDWNKGGNRRAAYAVLAVSCGIFAYFYPILTAAELAGADSFKYWTWIEGWI